MAASVAVRYGSHTKLSTAVFGAEIVRVLLTAQILWTPRDIGCVGNAGTFASLEGAAFPEHLRAQQ